MNDPHQTYQREVYGAIGNVASAWSLLERCIDIWIWLLMGRGAKEAACLTSQMLSVRSKLMSLEALAELKGASPQLLKDLRVFRNDTEAPARKRNEIVHSPVTLVLEPESEVAKAYRQVVSVNKILVLEDKPFDALECYRFARDIVKLNTRFMALMTGFAADLYPLQRQAFLELQAKLPQSS